MTIYVEDINDQCPGFDISAYKGSMSPDDTFVLVEDGTDRLRIVATDKDVSVSRLFLVVLYNSICCVFYISQNWV